MKLILFLLVGIFLYTESSACSCEPEERDSTVHKALLNSDLIFIGELIECNYDDPFVLAYKFKINELFKGNYSKDTINGCIEGMCSMIPNEPGLWIVYAKQINDSTIEINQCSPSISLNKTKILIPPPWLFPHFKNQIPDSLKVEIYLLERKVDGITYWLADLEKLKTYKRVHSPVSKRIGSHIFIIVFLVFINIALLIITIYLLRKRSK